MNITPLSIGIKIGRCADVGHLENVNMNICFYKQAVNVGTGWDLVYHQIRSHTTGYIFGGTDWEQINNCNVFEAHIGMYFQAESELPGEYPPPSVASGNMNGGGCDQCEYTIICDKVNWQLGFQFSNAIFAGVMVFNETNTGKLMFNNCTFARRYRGEGWLIIKSDPGLLLVNNCSFNKHDQGDIDNSYWANIVDCRNGKTILSNCAFDNMGSARYIRQSGVNTYVYGTNLIMNPNLVNIGNASNVSLINCLTN